MLDKIVRPGGIKPIMGYSTRTAYTQVQLGLLPPPVTLAAKATGWPESELAAVQRARIAGKSESFIKQLVQDLVVKRAELAEGMA
jgi:prophage regulatory protein